MPSEDTSTTKEPEKITYYIETNDGMFRVNVPKTWTINVDHTRGGMVIAILSDENNSDRLVYTNINQIRDSSAQMQSLSPTNEQAVLDGQDSTYEWVDHPIHVPVSRFTAEALVNQARRRRRVSLTEDLFDDYDDGVAGV